MKNDCADIRVLEGSTQLSIWVGEDSCNTTETDIYFKVPSFSPGDISIDLYYGDLSLSSVQNANDTFPLYFDDFNRNNLFSKVDGNGNSYEIITSSGSAVNGMGNFQIDGDKLRLSTNSGGYNHKFKFYIDKTDNASVVAGVKTLWTSEGSSSYSGGGIEFTRVGGWMQTYFKYSGGSYGTGSRLKGNTQRWSTNPITPNVTYHYELEVLKNDLNQNCFRQGCTWNQTRSGSLVPDLYPDQYFISNGATRTGFLWTIDYLFVRKTLETGDPAINVSAEGPGN